MKKCFHTIPATEQYMAH